MFKRDSVIVAIRASTAIGFLIVAAGLAMPQAANAQTCHPAPVGLISWWAADNNPLDSRSRNNGTLTNGATLTAGHVGQAFSFDGNDDSVFVPSNPMLDPASGRITVEAWVNPTAFNGHGSIINKRTTSNNAGYTLEHNNLGQVVWAVFVGGSVFTANSISTLPLDTWTHVAGAYDGTTLTIYINGLSAGSVNSSGGSVSTTTGDLVIGENIFNATNWTGLIDEPSVYDRALSDTEIAAIHAAGTAGKCKPTATIAPSGLVAWYGGDGNANDISGNNLNGTMQQGADFAIGKVGQAFRLDGGTDYVDLGPGFNLDNLTLEAWVFIDPAINVFLRRIISKDNLFLGGTRKLFILNSSCPPPGTGIDGGGCFAVAIGSSVDVVNAPSAMTSGWHHLAGVRDTSANRFEFYVDGVMVASTTPTVVGTIDSDVNTIIGRVNPVAGLEGFQGLVDEAGIFNRALTPEEITSIFNAGIAGKLKTATTPAGANVSTNAGGDATINFSSALTAGITQQIPLDPAVLPALPLGFTGTGLFYDLATTAGFTGDATVCFNLPSINDQPTFSQLKVLHQESGTWVDRTTGQDFPSRTLCSQVSSFSPFAIAGGSTPTSAAAVISGQVTTPDGIALGGVLVTLSGAKSVWTLTDSKGNYRFDSVDTDNFYTVTPELANYSFSPANRSFSLLGNKTDAGFTAVPNTAPVGNAIDTSEYFVRQHYLDFLGREPDQGGLEYWNHEIARCGNDTACVDRRRIDVSASFFMAREFQQTGSFVYGLYKASFGNHPSYQQFTADRAKVVGGVDLEARKNALAAEWVQRDSFRQAYPDSMSTEQFVNKLFESAGLIPHTGEWETYVIMLNNGGTRAQVLRLLTESDVFATKEYNATFVLMEYFAYLKRDPDPGGYDFWLDVLNNREPGNFRGMVCSFITSTEYQKRFSSVVTRSNAQCGN